MMAVVAIIGVMSGMSISATRRMAERAKQARAIGDLRILLIELNGMDVLPATLAGIKRGGMLDPWGREYVFYPFPPSSEQGQSHPPGARKDRFLVPINSRFDLYSKGPDGESVAPLTAQASRDDIIVANDGDFIGKAVNY